MLIHSKMYEYADRYDIEGLKELTAKKFERWVEKFYSHESFMEVVDDVYTSMPDEDTGLRAVVINILCKHGEMTAKPEVEELLRYYNLWEELFKTKMRLLGHR